MTDPQNDTAQHDVPEPGPLGPGRTLVKDPLKGLRGVMSGTLVLEAITIWLSLTVILKIQGGALWTPFNIWFIVILGVLHFVMAFLQKIPRALQINLALQALGLAGFFVHWSVGAIIVIYIFVWWYVLALRRNMIERMQRGLLVSQHLGTAEDEK